MSFTRQEQYAKIKQLPPEVIAAYVDVQLLGNARLALGKIRKIRLTDNFLEWRGEIETLLESITEAWSELAGYPDEYKEIFASEWREYFEGGD